MANEVHRSQKCSYQFYNAMLPERVAHQAPDEPPVALSDSMDTVFLFTSEEAELRGAAKERYKAWILLSEA